MTLKMTTAQVVETSVTVTNSSFQNYTHPDDHTTRTTDTPRFKPFTKKIDCFIFLFLFSFIIFFASFKQKTIFQNLFSHPHFIIRIFPSAFYHPHCPIRIFPSAFSHLHFIIRILSSAFCHPHFIIRHPPSAAIRSSFYRDPVKTFDCFFIIFSEA